MIRSSVIRLAEPLVGVTTTDNEAGTIEKLAEGGTDAGFIEQNVVIYQMRHSWLAG
jgi:hypothetical protein